MLQIGYTMDIEKRVKRHNKGRNKIMAGRLPLPLIFSEFYLFKQDALKSETYFITSMGKKTTRLMLKETLEKL